MTPKGARTTFLADLAHRHFFNCRRETPPSNAGKLTGPPPGGMIAPTRVAQKDVGRSEG